MNIEQKKLDFLNQIGTNNKSHSGYDHIPDKRRVYASQHLKASEASL